MIKIWLIEFDVCELDFGFGEFFEIGMEFNVKMVQNSAMDVENFGQFFK